MFVASIFRLTAQNNFSLKCLKTLKTTLKLFTLTDQYFSWVNSRTGKYSDCVNQEGNTMITNDQSHLSSRSTQRNSFDNNINLINMLIMPYVIKPYFHTS